MLKKLSIITVILLIAGVALLLIESNKDSLTITDRSGQPILMSLDSANLNKILIQVNNHPVELVKNEADSWIVKSLNYEANAEDIQELLLELLEIKVGDLTTDNPERHARFHVLLAKENEEKWEEEKTGTLIRLVDSNDTAILELILGKDRSSGSGQYIRFAGEPAVYLIPDNIIVETENEDWLNKDIINIDGKKLVKSFQLQRPDPPLLQINREDEKGKWNFTNSIDNETVNESAVNTLVDTLKDLEFSKLLPATSSDEETGRQQKTSFKAQLFDGREVDLVIGEKEVTEDDYYYVSIQMALTEGIDNATLQSEVEKFNRRSQSWLYALNSWKGKKFLKQRSDFVQSE